MKRREFVKGLSLAGISAAAATRVQGEAPSEAAVSAGAGTQEGTIEEKDKPKCKICVTPPEAVTAIAFLEQKLRSNPDWRNDPVLKRIRLDLQDIDAALKLNIGTPRPPNDPVRPYAGEQDDRNEPPQPGVYGLRSCG
jgi:hypothetical protein